MLVNLRAPLLLALLVVGRCGAAPDGFELTRTAQPTSPSASDVAVFNFTYGLPAGSSQRLDCTADGGTLPPHSSSTWWPQGVTVKIPGLADGMHNLSCAICNGTAAPGNNVTCSTPRSVYSWLQLRVAPTAIIKSCPGAKPGEPQNTTTAQLEFGAACASLPNAVCPKEAHVQWDSFCALASDPDKRTITKKSSTGKDTCTLPEEWATQEVLVHVEAYVKGRTAGRSTAVGASCNYTFEYIGMIGH